MMKGIDNAQVQANYATPELRGLFEEWIVQIEEEIYEFYQGKEKINLQEAVDYFHLKEESIQYILTRLTQKGKLEIKPF
ncbi:MAG: hypothetical protein JEY91_07650 [Spirochaetaceae bacterium]|nr:hypothetical protein [Spirochaetaceae bacterium]